MNIDIPTELFDKNSSEYQDLLDRYRKFFSPQAKQLPLITKNLKYNIRAIDEHIFPNLVRIFGGQEKLLEAMKRSNFVNDMISPIIESKFNEMEMEKEKAVQETKRATTKDIVQKLNANYDSNSIDTLKGTGQSATSHEKVRRVQFFENPASAKDRSKKPRDRKRVANEPSQSSILRNLLIVTVQKFGGGFVVDELKHNSNSRNGWATICNELNSHSELSIELQNWLKESGRGTDLKTIYIKLVDLSEEAKNEIIAFLLNKPINGDLLDQD